MAAPEWKPPPPAPHGQTNLDRRMEALLGDSLPKHLGSGWFSGVFGVLLGVGSFLAVLVFRYPQWLTSSETAARYPVETMRMILALAIVAGFGLSALNILLRPAKRLGLTGLFFCMLAVLAGGSAVEVGGGSAAFRVGLDWFILNVVLLAIVFIPLEQRFPLNAEQGTFRPGWTTDGIYFLVSHVAVELLTFFTLLPATLVARAFHAQTSGLDPSVLPLALEVLAIMLVADLTQYTVHRAFHRVGWLWPFHAIHHSARALDWLAGSRLHVVDIIVTRALILVPLFALGFSQTALYVWLVIVAVQATLNHVNIRFDVPVLNQVIVLPRFHHWHHAMTPVDKNFAVHFPWIDRLLGTYHMPEGQWPPATGIADDRLPAEFSRQLIWPFRRRGT